MKKPLYKNGKCQYQIKNRYIPMLIFTIYCIGILFSIPIHDNVKGAVVSYSFGFENVVAGQQITHGLPSGSDNIFDSWKISGTTAYVSSSSPPVGTRCYLINNGVAQFNATYSKNQYLTSFTGYYTGGSYVGWQLTYYFYNSTYETYSTAMIQIRNTYTYGQGQYLDETGTWQDLGFQWAGNCSWNIINDIGDVNYTRGASYCLGVAHQPSHINSGYRIDRFRFTISNGANDCRYDAWIWELSGYYGEGQSGGSGCGYNLSSYDSIGDFYSGNSAQIQSQIIRQPYNVYWNGTIRAIQLQCDLAQFQYDSETSHYRLYYWLTNIGEPDCIEIIGGSTVITWLTDIQCTGDSTLSFEFYHSEPLYVGTSTYWQVCTGASYQDLNNDGFTRYYVGGTTAYPVSSSGGEYKDLSMKFYVDSIYTPPVIDYSDTIGLSNYLYANATGYVFDIDTDIVIRYTLSSISYGYYINMAHNDTFDLYDLFPYNDLRYPASSFRFRPYDIGKYYFILFTPSGNETVTAWVTYGSDGIKSNYSVWTEPNPTNCGDDYTVNVHFNSGDDNITGFVACFHGEENTGNLSRSVWSYPLYNEKDMVYAIPYSPLYSCQNEYWQIFKTVGSNNIQVGSIHLHYVYSNDVGSNSITCDNSLLIYSGNKEHRKFGIAWTHLFSGSSSVYIKVQDIFFSNCPSSLGTLYYEPHSVGIYKADLCINQNGTEIILDTDYCTVSLDIVPPSTSPDNPAIDQYWLNILHIDAPICYIVGVIIIVIFMMIPILLTKGSNVDGIAIALVSLIMGVVGMVLDILLGYIPIWSVVLVVIICALAIMIMWLRNRQ